MQPRHRVVHSLRVAHVEAPLHQRPVLGDECLGEEGGERVRLGGPRLYPERVEHRSVRRGEFLLLRRGGSVDGGVGGGLFDGAEALAQRLAARVLVHVDVVVAHRRRGRHLLGQAVRGRLSLALARASAAAAGRRAVDYSRKRCFGCREKWVGTGWDRQFAIVGVARVMYDRGWDPGFSLGGAGTHPSASCATEGNRLFFSLGCFLCQVLRSAGVRSLLGVTEVRSLAG